MFSSRFAFTGKSNQTMCLLLLTCLLVWRNTRAISGPREHISSQRICSSVLSMKKDAIKGRKSVLTTTSRNPEPSTEIAIHDKDFFHGGEQPAKTPGLWPCFDELDRRLISISLPVIANFAIGPLIGAIDLFWVNRMGNALAVAGQSAANQVFNSAFMLASFLPSGEL